MTQLPTWFNEMQTQAKALMPSLKLPKADRTNIKNWEFDFIESQKTVSYKENEIPTFCFTFSMMKMSKMLLLYVMELWFIKNYQIHLMELS